MITIPRPAESGHWYTIDGLPCYEVKAKDGNLRPTTLRDARKLNLVPSVTTISKCAAAPGLENWKAQQVLLAALTLPKIEGEAEDAYIRRIMDDSRETARKAAERGTAIHAAIQGHYEGIPPHEDYWPHVKATADLIAANFGNHAWKAEESFAHPAGFGGKCDLSGQDLVIDFKTKEFGPDDAKRLAWDEHAMQLAAYRVGLGMPDAKCANVFISTTHPGHVALHVWAEDELLKGWQCFLALLTYWQARNGYMPVFDKAAA